MRHRVYEEHANTFICPTFCLALFTIQGNKSDNISSELESNEVY